MRIIIIIIIITIIVIIIIIIIAIIVQHARMYALGGSVSVRGGCGMAKSVYGMSDRAV
jgi:preprotein translocase subunit SecG